METVADQKEASARQVVADLRMCDGRKKFVVTTGNYSVGVRLDSGRVYCEYWGCIDSGWQSIYFDSEESVQRAILKVGSDRIIAAAKWWACGE